jgi:hypothetical protein
MSCVVSKPSFLQRLEIINYDRFSYRLNATDLGRIIDLIGHNGIYIRGDKEYTGI